MQFFNQFYKDVFKVGGLATNDKIKFAINNYNDYKRLIEAMDNSKYFSNPKLKELAAIKGLYDSFILQIIFQKILFQFLIISRKQPVGFS